MKKHDMVILVLYSSHDKINSVYNTLGCTACLLHAY